MSDSSAFQLLDALSTGELELVALSWMEEQMEIPAEVGELILIYRGAIPPDPDGERDREKLLATLQDPAELVEVYQRWKIHSTKLMMQLLIPVCYTHETSFPVSRYALEHILLINGEERPYFEGFLRESGILQAVSESSWGEEWEHWHFVPEWINFNRDRLLNLYDPNLYLRPTAKALGELAEQVLTYLKQEPLEGLSLPERYSHLAEKFEVTPTDIVEMEYVAHMRAYLEPTYVVEASGRPR